MPVEIRDITPNPMMNAAYREGSLSIDRLACLAALLPGALSLLPGCGSEPGIPVDFTSDTVIVSLAGSFQDSWRQERTFLLAQEDRESLIAFVRDAVLTPAGDIWIIDGSEGHAKLFSSEGAFLTTFGRLGDGPGEFRQPIDARIDPQERLVILDLTHRRIQTFAHDGELLGITSVAHIPNPIGFSPLSDSTWIVLSSGSGFQGVPGEIPDVSNVLRYVGPDGEVMSSGLTIGSLLPSADAEPAPYWDVMRHFWLDVAGAHAFVTTTLRPVLWIVDLDTFTERSGGVRDIWLLIPDYAAPEDPEDISDFRVARELVEWFHANAEWVGRPTVTDAGVFVPLNRSRFLGEGPMRLLHAPDMKLEEWRVYEDAFTVIGQLGDSIFVIEDPRADSLTIGVYTLR